MRVGRQAFSLVEVVLALGVCSFVLIALIGLFHVGLQNSRDAEQRIQAANLASQILALRRASPTNDASLPSFAIPASALTNVYGEVFGSQGGSVGLDGRTNSGAVYRIQCQAGTNAVTGGRMAQVRLVLSWPPQAALSNAAGYYETVTCIPLY